MTKLEELKKRCRFEYGIWYTDPKWLGVPFECYLIDIIMQMEDEAENQRLEAREEYPD